MLQAGKVIRERERKKKIKTQGKEEVTGESGGVIDMNEKLHLQDGVNESGSK